MTTDVKMCYKQGYDPLLLTQEKTPSYVTYKDKTKRIKTQLNELKIFGSDRSIVPLREKIIKIPESFGTFTTKFNGGEFSAIKTISRFELGTHNSSTIIDFAEKGTKGFELTRDLPNGDVLELVMKKSKDGTGKVLKFETRNGLGNNIAELAKQLGKLDPLANKWIKTALKLLI